MDDYDCAACGGDGDRPAGLDWVTCIYCRGSGLSSAGHRALEEKKFGNRHTTYCKIDQHPYTKSMNNAASNAVATKIDYTIEYFMQVCRGLCNKGSRSKAGKAREMQTVVECHELMMR